MLSNGTELFEDEFTPAEYDAIKNHHQTSKDTEINWTKLFEAWRDLNGKLCVMYQNGITYRYTEDGKHRKIKYVLVGEWSNGTKHHESNFTSEDDLVESINAYYRLMKDNTVCSNGCTITDFSGYVDGKKEY